jgi:hypothetical protein
MGSKSKRKGKDGEREAAIFLEGTRIWEHLHDVLDKFGRYWEVKRYGTGFTKLYDALEEHALHYRESGDGPIPLVLLRQDNKPWLVVFYAHNWKDGDANSRFVAEG